MAYLDSNGLTKVWAKIIALFNSHVNNTNNPHEVTLSKLGVTSTATELNYCDGVTSNIQNQLDGKQTAGSYASSSHTHTKSEIIDFPTPIDNLISTSTIEPLSANQGRVLKEQVDGKALASGGIITNAYMSKYVYFYDYDDNNSSTTKRSAYLRDGNWYTNFSNIYSSNGYTVCSQQNTSMKVWVGAEASKGTDGNTLYFCY